MNIEEIIGCLGKIAKILHEKPEAALKDLHTTSSLIDGQIPYRDGHMQRVSDYSMLIGKKIGLEPGELVTLEAAALLHDFGKIGIDEGILMKTGKLNDLERREIEMHVLRGYFMLQGFAEMADAIEGVKSHEALAELRTCAGTQFDPHIVEVFIKIVNANSAHAISI